MAPAGATGFAGRYSRKADEAARLTRLGAELIATRDDRGRLTYVMRDPEGNEFCLHWIAESRGYWVGCAARSRDRFV